MIEYRENEFAVGCDTCSNHRIFRQIYSFQEGTAELKKAGWSNRPTIDPDTKEEYWEQLCPVCRKAS